MKKILYISVNSKEEADSASKTVARKLINEVLSECKYRVPKTHKRHSEHFHGSDNKCDDNECLCKDEFHNYIDIESHKDDIKRACCEEKSKPIDEKIQNEKIVCETKYDVDNHNSNEVKEKTKCEVTDMNNMAKSALEKHKDENAKAPEESNVKEDNLNQAKTVDNEEKKCCGSNSSEESKYEDKKASECSAMKHEEKKEECCSSHDKSQEKTSECCDEKHHHHHGEECYEKEHHHHHHEDEKCCGEKVMDFIHNKMCDKDEDWEECNEFVVEEIDLYKDYIPLLRHEYYECRNTVVEGPGPCYENLTDEQRKDVERIKELAMQFKEADIYIIAAPMWSLLFPAPLKQYIDCIMLNGVTATINKHECKGLLDDKERKMVFVQSVGGELPILIKSRLDHSSGYLKDIAKFLKISKFEELLVDGTGYTQYEKEEAIYEATKDIPHIAKMLIK